MDDRLGRRRFVGAALLLLAFALTPDVRGVEAMRGMTELDIDELVQVRRGEDIKRMGAKTLADALRGVPGLAVARTRANVWAVSARGFDDNLVNKLLVLIDGRSVHSPLRSGVYWDVQDTLLEDVDRIEIIRGPGGSLWGANAINGVINVITNVRHPSGFEQRALSLV